ncbi:hypothetical protein BBW65_03870 [Helicobacter enhydrae]|uniref:LysE family translocator n=1 Tax=Helicobacter enhydrae TaxID=222136 RepID=A0A1B1U5F4_9HELI|nr:LysE family transporter [Helicobacter enhydrae]ANV97988.1 hypothetical protein BBW65_03870 [Helicobacter enhydrae]
MLEFLLSSAVLGILSIWVSAVVMPGADMFLVVRTTIAKGKKYAIGSVAGIVLGTLVWLVLGFFAIALLQEANLLVVIQMCGGIYLVYLAFGIFKSLGKQAWDLENELRFEETAWKSFIQGLLTNLLNPKPIVFVSIILSQLPPKVPLDCLLLLLGIMLLIPSVWFCCVVEFLSIKRVFELFMRYSKRIDQVTMIVFLGFGVSLVFQSGMKLAGF